MKLGMIIKSVIVGTLGLLIGLLSVFLLGFILAFPIKWAWNYAIVSTFALPVINWGKAWCLAFLAGILIKSSK